MPALVWIGLLLLAEIELLVTVILVVREGRRAQRITHERLDRISREMTRLVEILRENTLALDRVADILRFDRKVETDPLIPSPHAHQ